jgi:hypothetical protein
MKNELLTSPDQHPINRVIGAYAKQAASDRRAAARERAAEREANAQAALDGLLEELQG